MIYMYKNGKIYKSVIKRAYLITRKGFKIVNKFIMLSSKKIVREALRSGNIWELK